MACHRRSGPGGPEIRSKLHMEPVDRVSQVREFSQVRELEVRVQELVRFENSRISQVRVREKVQLLLFISSLVRAKLSKTINFDKLRLQFRLT